MVLSPARWIALFLGIVPLGGVVAAPPVSTYAQVTNFDALALAPDGSKYAGVVGDEYKAVVQIATLPANDVIVRSPFDKASIVALEWAGPEYLIATIRSALPTKDGLLRIVYTVQKFDMKNRRWSGLLQNSSVYRPWVSKSAATRVVDGRPYAFLTGYTPKGRSGDVLALLRVNLESGQVQLVEEGNDWTTGWVLDSTGRANARADYDVTKGKWDLYGRARGVPKWTLLDTSSDRINQPSLSGLGASDDEVLYSKRINDVWVPYSRNLATGDLAIDDTDVGLTDPATGLQIAFMNEKPDGIETTFVDPVDRKLWLNVVKAWPGELVHFLGWSKDRNIVLVGVSGRRSGAGVFVVDRQAKTARKLIDDVPGLAATDYAEQRPIRFRASDGVEIPAILTLPPGRPEKGLALIVLPSSSRVSLGYDWQPQALASRGYAVLQPQPRGVSGFGKDFVLAGKGEWGGKQVSDLSDGARSLARDGIIDPSRVCVAGFYYAGSQAILAASRDKSLYRCAATMFGFHDFRKQFELYRSLAGSGGDAAAIRRLRELLGVASPLDPLSAALSPINQVASIDAPVLLMALKSSPRKTDAMEAALKRNGKPSERVAVTVDDWNRSNPGRIQVIEGLVAFLEKHNSPAPVSAGAAAGAAQ